HQAATRCAASIWITSELLPDLLDTSLQILNPDKADRTQLTIGVMIFFTDTMFTNDVAPVALLDLDLLIWGLSFTGLLNPLAPHIFAISFVFGLGIWVRSCLELVGPDVRDVSRFLPSGPDPGCPTTSRRTSVQITNVPNPQEFQTQLELQILRTSRHFLFTVIYREENGMVNATR
ncbi:hypothetical protein F4814DRAFT_457112, partial [Daldinia grandis]